MATKQSDCRPGDPQTVRSCAKLSGGGCRQYTGRHARRDRMRLAWCMSLASAFQFRPEACDRVRGFLGPANSSLRAHEGPSCKYLPFAENNFSLPSLIYRHIPKAGSSTAQMLLWKLWTHVVEHAAARPSPAVAHRRQPPARRAAHRPRRQLRRPAARRGETRAGAIEFAIVREPYERFVSGYYFTGENLLASGEDGGLDRLAEYLSENRYAMADGNVHHFLQVFFLCHCGQSTARRRRPPCARSVRHVLQLEHLSDHFFGFADQLFAGTAIPRMPREIPGPGSGEHKMQNVGANSFASFAAMWASIAAGSSIAGCSARSSAPTRHPRQLHETRVCGGGRIEPGRRARASAADRGLVGRLPNSTRCPAPDLRAGFDRRGDGPRKYVDGCVTDQIVRGTARGSGRWLGDDVSEQRNVRGDGRRRVTPHHARQRRWLGDDIRAEERPRRQAAAAASMRHQARQRPVARRRHQRVEERSRRPRPRREQASRARRRPPRVRDHARSTSAAAAADSARSVASQDARALPRLRARPPRRARLAVGRAELGDKLCARRLGRERKRAARSRAAAFCLEPRDERAERRARGLLRARAARRRRARRPHRARLAPGRPRPRRYPAARPRPARARPPASRRDRGAGSAAAAPSSRCKASCSARAACSSAARAFASFATRPLCASRRARGKLVIRRAPSRSNARGQTARLRGIASSARRATRVERARAMFLARARGRLVLRVVRDVAALRASSELVAELRGNHPSAFASPLRASSTAPRARRDRGARGGSARGAHALDTRLRVARRR